MPLDGKKIAFLVAPEGVEQVDLTDQLRTDREAVAFVKGFLDAGKPVAAVCHAPWTLAEADADWVDREVVVDTSGPGPLVTSRRPRGPSWGR